MASNVGNTSGFQCVAATKADEMRAYDLLPPDLREALRNAVLPFSAIDALERLMFQGVPIYQAVRDLRISDAIIVARTSILPPELQ